MTVHCQKTPAYFVAIKSMLAVSLGLLRAFCLLLHFAGRENSHNFKAPKYNTDFSGTFISPPMTKLQVSWPYISSSFVFFAIRWEGWKHNYYHFPVLFIFRNFIEDFAIIFLCSEVLLEQCEVGSGSEWKWGLANLFSSSVELSWMFHSSTWTYIAHFDLCSQVTKVIMEAAVSVGQSWLTWWQVFSEIVYFQLLPWK